MVATLARSGRAGWRGGSRWYDRAHAPGRTGPDAAEGRRAAFGRLERPLLHRVAEGDGGAVRACLAQYGGLVWTLTRRAGFAGAEADDAVQEVFAELWRCGGRFDPAIASETAFIAMIARRRLVDRRRRLARRPDGASLDGSMPGMAVAPMAAEGLGDEAARAAAALQELSAEQQRVLRLSVYEGLSHESISRATGLPLGTVKTHARRALMRLREALGVAQAAGGGA